jgi:hypothetical protein
MPMPSLTATERRIFGKAIQAELPYYLDYLFHSLTIPDHIKDQRFEIKPYCSPKIRELLEAYSPEGKIIAAINESDLFRIPEGGAQIPYWEGSASELLWKIRDVISYRLVDNTMELGRLLTRLHERKHPQVIKKIIDGSVRYRIRNLTRVKPPEY